MFFTSQHWIGYQSFEASRKMTRHQQSINLAWVWHHFHLALDGDRTFRSWAEYSTARPQLSVLVMNIDIFFDISKKIAPQIIRETASTTVWFRVVCTWFCSLMLGSRHFLLIPQKYWLFKKQSNHTKMNIWLLSTRLSLKPCYTRYLQNEKKENCQRNFFQNRPWQLPTKVQVRPSLKFW